MKTDLRLLFIIFFLNCSARADISNQAKIADMGSAVFSIQSSGFDPALFSKLMDYTRDNDLVVKVDAYGAIASIAKQVEQPYLGMVLNLLEEGLHDPLQGVRRESAEAAKFYGPRAERLSASLMAAALKYPHTDIAVFSIEAIERIGAHSDLVVPELIKIVVSSKDAPDSGNVVTGPGTLHAEVVPAIKALAVFKDYSAQIVKALGPCLTSENHWYLGALVVTIATLDPKYQDSNFDNVLLFLSNRVGVLDRDAVLDALEKISTWSPVEQEIITRALADTNPAINYHANKIVAVRREAKSGNQ